MPRFVAGFYLVYSGQNSERKYGTYLKYSLTTLARTRSTLSLNMIKRSGTQEKVGDGNSVRREDKRKDQEENGQSNIYIRLTYQNLSVYLAYSNACNAPASCAVLLNYRRTHNIF